MNMRLHFLPLLLLSLSLPSAARTRAPQGCSGCLGAGAASTASNGTSGGMVKITLTVESGGCGWALTEDHLLMECKQASGCSTTVFREWSGLPSGTVLDFCVEVEDEIYCLKKSPVVDGDGNGSSSRLGPELPCSALASDQFVFEIHSDSAGLTAEASGRCSGCQGDI